MDNEVPKQLNLSSNGITNERGTGEKYLHFVFHAHLCPVGPRVLDSCSLAIRTIHIWEALWTPLSQSLIHSYFLGPQSSLGLYYYLVLMPCLLLYLRLCEEHRTV